LLDVRRDRIRFVTRSVETYGDIVGFHMPHRNLVLLRHPDHIRHVLCGNPGNYCKGLGLRDATDLLGDGLLTSDGDLWTSRRRILQTAFQRDRLQSYQASIGEAAASLAGRWERAAISGIVLDAGGEFAIATLRIATRALFEAELDDGALDEIAADLEIAGQMAMARMTAFVPLPRWLPTRANTRTAAAIRRLETRVDEIARGYVAGRHAPGSALRRLIEGVAGEPDPRRAVRNEILTFLLAGHETTAATLTWALYLLARNRDCLETLRQEVDQLEDVSKLAYTRMTIDETMRLYPPVWMLPRRAAAADCIGGYDVPAGSDVLISLYSMHRHPSFWTDPERFKPGRFAVQGRPGAGAYLPFGSGPRTCVGASLGLLEAVTLLATVAGRFDFRLESGEDAECEAALSLRPKHGLRISVQRRAERQPQTANSEKLSYPACPYHCPMAESQPKDRRSTHD
jgi:cytochrome P450